MQNQPLRSLIAQSIVKVRDRQRQKFLASLNDCAKVQRHRLQRILQCLDGSDFAKLYKLTAKLTPNAFRNRLDVGTYERHRPYVQNLMTKKSSKALLFNHQFQLIMFAMTSGSTDKPKYIPVTTMSLKEYQASWTIWGLFVAQQHPRIFAGSVLHLTGSSYHHSTPSGVPIGTMSGLLVDAMSIRSKLLHFLPACVAYIQDPLLKQYVTLRIALTQSDLRMLITANPSSVISLANRLASDQYCLIGDLFNGTTKGISEVPAKIRKELWPLLTLKDINLARQFDRILRHESLCPHHIWPDLQVISVWMGGHAARYLPEVNRLFPNVPIRDHGLSASEGRMTIPTIDHDPSGILNIHGSYFEFIPEAEWQSSSPLTLLPEHLEVNQRYDLVVTTTGGLVRYRMEDIVECTGFIGTTPRIKFVAKGGVYGNLTGEKVSLWQVSRALDVCRDILSLQEFWQEYCVAPVLEQIGFYAIFIELSQDKGTPIGSVAPLSRLAQLFDAELCALNPEYKDKRQSQRLASPQVIYVTKGTFVRLKNLIISEQKVAAEQFKHPFLLNNIPYIEFLKANTVNYLTKLAN